MDIRIKATDYQLTPEVETYLESRLQSVEKLLSEDSSTVRCEIELGRDAGRPRHGANLWFAEIRIIQPGGGGRIYARNNAETVNAAIDDVKEEIEKQLRKEKQVHIRLLRKTGGAIKRWMRLDA